MKRLHAGKIRELYELDADRVLIVASDRISAFDVVFAEEIPDKGKVLTAMTTFWCRYLADVVPTHFVSVDSDDVPEQLLGRAMIARRAEMLPLECIVRGYLTGSAWGEYSRSGTMHGQVLPPGLDEAARLPQPVFTPSTKATTGHDVNIGFDEAAELVGTDVAKSAAELSLAAYEAGAARAAQRGIIIADTKFELGFVDGELVIADEILTPDSSRFWPADAWRVGSSPPSLDQQPVRDATEASGWDKKPPPPRLGEEVIDSTRARYIEAYERLTNLSFADWCAT